MLPADWIPENSKIKVIGVGGGGCNAVTYMYNKKIQGCSFIITNTDAQVLEKSNVPVKIQMGEGLGAGTDAVQGRKDAIESQAKFEAAILDTGTQMLFVTTGLGGGTGTGAAPVIANLAKKNNILTVGVVTLPFDDDGDETKTRAYDGLQEMKKNVDSLIVIDNEKLYDYYGDVLAQDAYPKTDEILATAVGGITEIISRPGYRNVDFKDVQNMMKNSGRALMGSGTGTGENRIEDAVRQALESSLLEDFDLKTAKNMLVNITAGKNENGIKMSEMKMIDKLIKEYTGGANNFKKGVVFDESPDFGDKVCITVIITGFKGAEMAGPTNLGNYIMLDSNFVYEKARKEQGTEIELQDSPYTVNKVGFSNTANIRKFDFRGKPRPILLVEPGESLAPLENEPAIRRGARMLANNTSAEA